MFFFLNTQTINDVNWWKSFTIWYIICKSKMEKRNNYYICTAFFEVYVGHI